MSDYYCGITNDLKRREEEHNAKILFAVKMANANEAKEVEAKLHDMGFDTGKQLGNGRDDRVNFLGHAFERQLKGSTKVKKYILRSFYKKIVYLLKGDYL